jgi:diguanylate cyclase (GGDEF)-like protein/PAS domain S-box-containing protein
VSSRMADKEIDEAKAHKQREKELKKLTRRAERAEDQLENYGRLVDRTQHLLNTRIAEVEMARKALSERTQELEQSERRFRQLADAAFETIIIHHNGVIVDCNEAASHLYGLSKNELVGKKIIELVDTTHLDEKNNWTKKAIEKPVEGIHLRTDKKVPVEVRSRAIELKGEAALVTAVRDITEHKQMEEYLKKIANSDVLTGVGNRRFFLDVGKKEYNRANRYNLPLSLLMMDIDKFKNINDTYGHDIGDIALKALADICCKTLRDCDIFARLGGEEFAVILPNTELEGGFLLAERLRVCIQNMVTPTEKGDIQYTVSMGLTVIHGDPENKEEDIEIMLNRADKGLYFAKEGGRNQVVKV